MGNYGVDGGLCLEFDFISEWTIYYENSIRCLNHC